MGTNTQSLSLREGWGRSEIVGPEKGTRPGRRKVSSAGLRPCSTAADRTSAPAIRSSAGGGRPRRLHIITTAESESARSTPGVACLHPATVVKSTPSRFSAL